MSMIFADYFPHDNTVVKASLISTLMADQVRMHISCKLDTRSKQLVEFVLTIFYFHKTELGSVEENPYMCPSPVLCFIGTYSIQMKRIECGIKLNTTLSNLVYCLFTARFKGRYMQISLITSQTTSLSISRSDNPNLG